MDQAFDTLRAAHELGASGFSCEQAETIAAIVRGGQGDLTADLRELRAELKQDHTELRGELRELEVR